ncbi:hypothetical protein [Aureibacillus halotolerans]|uniref:Uncharacterized protein n=1 Tax=Aureibacillus halotolerans TaxID=1508390 RepID=A0A4R6TWT7_9BACI|nr:hypothetical protein [Aureibacillus halotolerans]TDQ37951.1 hypothetical protein EV213_11129 [Aureibacillus halotolerans]
MLSEEAEAVPGGKVNTMRYSRIDVDLIPFMVQAKYFDEAVVIYGLEVRFVRRSQH